MVKLCSPFVLSGVVDSSFPRTGGGPGTSIKAPQEANVWQGKLPGTTQAGAEAGLAIALKTDAPPNHQKFGRPTIHGEVWSRLDPYVYAPGLD
jgi:hypothetical protein